MKELAWKWYNLGCIHAGSIDDECSFPIKERKKEFEEKWKSEQKGMTKESFPKAQWDKICKQIEYAFNMYITPTGNEIKKLEQAVLDFISWTMYYTEVEK